MLQIAIILAIICGFTCVVKPLQKRLSGRMYRLLLVGAFLVYVAGNLYFTILSREPMPARLIELRPFASYVRMFQEPLGVVGNELNGWLAKFFLSSEYAVHGIILNVLLYVPLGYILPLLFPKLYRSQILLISLAATVGTELTQMITRLGWCETDDVLHNMLGAAIGYLIYSKQSVKHKPQIQEKA